MHPSITTSYLLPAILLNPVLFLHSLNTILSRLLPPVVVASSAQPPPYSSLGPSANYPHLDIHASETLCWSYTVLIMIVQMIAFGRVSDQREKRRESKSRKEKRTMSFRLSANQEAKQTPGHIKQAPSPNDVEGREAVGSGHETHRESDDTTSSFSGTNSDSESTDRTTDSEVIL